MEPSKESLESALLSHRQRKPGESVEYFTPAFESELRTWGVKDSVLDLVSNISGGGILSLPFAFQCTGPMLGAALVGAAGAGSAWTIYALAALGRRTGAPSYAGIARHVYGRWLQLGVVFLVFASTFICMVTYTIFLQGIIVPLFEDYWFGDDAQAYTLPTTARVSLVGLVLIAAAPLCFPTTIRHLGFTNLLTVVCTGIFAIVLFLKALKACDAAALAAMDHRWTNPDPSAYLDQGVPIIVAAFLCHFNVLPVHNALQRPTRRRFKQVVSWTLFLTTITYLIIGLSGYFYGKCIQEDVSADIFLSFSNRDLLATLGRIAMFLVLIFSYPYFIIPCRESLDDLRLILNDSFVGHGDELGPAREFSRSSTTPCGRQHLGLPPPSPAEEGGGPPDTLPAADDDEPAEPAGRASCGGGGGGAAAADSPGEGCDRLLSGSPECAGCGLCAAGELLGGRPDAGESDNLSRFSDGNSLNGLYLGKSAVATTKRDVAATFGLLAVQLVISALVPELELWWNILGSFVTVALVFIFPCAAYIELRLWFVQPDHKTQPFEMINVAFFERPVGGGAQFLGPYADLALVGSGPRLAVLSLVVPPLPVQEFYHSSDVTAMTVNETNTELYLALREGQILTYAMEEDPEIFRQQPLISLHQPAAFHLGKMAAYMDSISDKDTRDGRASTEKFLGSVQRRNKHSETMEDFINETISSNPCVVFSKTYCPYCTNAKQALQQAGAKMVVIELDQESNGDAIQNALAAMTGRRTVPNVFIAGQTIGGGDDTVALARSGQLAGMLADAGAL